MQRLAHHAASPALRDMPADAQRQIDVVGGTCPGQQCGVLEHEADFAWLWLMAGVPDQPAGVRLVEAGDQAQQRGLAAA